MGKMASIRICSKNNRFVKELEAPPRAFRRVFCSYMETDGKRQVISTPPPISRAYLDSILGVSAIVVAEPVISSNRAPLRNIWFREEALSEALEHRMWIGSRGH